MRIALSKDSGLNSRKLAADLSFLVIRNERSAPFYKGIHPSLKFLKKYHQACIEMAMRKGICEPFYQGEKLVAVIVIGNLQLAPGLPIYWGFVETDRSKKADSWFLKKLEEHRAFFVQPSMFDIPHHLRHLLSRLYRLGYFIDTIRTLAGTQTAYARLMKQRKPTTENLTRLGFSVQRITSVAELKQIKEIEKKEFKRNPQYGWFVASEAWLNQTLKRRQGDLKNPGACLFVIKKRARVLGYFGYCPQPSYYKGKCVGTEFCFDQSIQGKGFSTLGYRLLLEHMLENKVDFFSGNTAQKPTLRLAKILGRRPQPYAIRFGKSPFSAKHFRY